MNFLNINGRKLHLSSLYVLMCPGYVGIPPVLKKSLGFSYYYCECTYRSHISLIHDCKDLKSVILHTKKTFHLFSYQRIFRLSKINLLSHLFVLHMQLRHSISHQNTNHLGRKFRKYPFLVNMFMYIFHAYYVCNNVSINVKN